MSVCRGLPPMKATAPALPHTAMTEARATPRAGTRCWADGAASWPRSPPKCVMAGRRRSEEHTSELQSLMRISYAVFCLKKKKKATTTNDHTHDTKDNETHNTTITHD